MRAIPGDWTPPARSIVYVGPAEDGQGVIIGCDCATTTHLIIDGAERLTEGVEMSFTCDGCQSVHWFTITPGGSGTGRPDAQDGQT